MQSLKLTCNLCGKELSINEITSKSGFLGLGENKAVSKNTINFNGKYGDLCSDCAKDLEDFIKFKKENK